MQRRILIVYDTFGLGHLRAARILEEILADNDTEIVMGAGSEMREEADVKFFADMWNYLLRKNMMKLADFMVNLLAHLIFIPLGEVMNARNFQKRLEEIDPDILICTADSFGRQLATYGRRHNVPLYIFITDIAIFYDLVNPYATHICYFEETAQAVRSFDFQEPYYNENIYGDSPRPARTAYFFKTVGGFLFKGLKRTMFRDAARRYPEVNQARCLCIGALAEKKHFAAKDATALKAKYHVSPDIDTVLLASGSLGGNLLLEVIEHLDQHGKRLLNLLVMCGNDEKIYQKISGLKNHHPRLNVLPFAYTDHFDEFLEMADCAIIRPSAGIFIESLIKQTPIISFRMATKNDLGTLSIINKYGVGQICDQYQELNCCLNEVLDHRETYRSNIEKFLAPYPADWEAKQAILRAMILSPENR